MELRWHPNVIQGKEVISGVNIHVKKEGFTVC
ncbi:hypothetical protein BLX05_11130 [Bacillus pseudomycoides]|nr:hypothetical protein BLX05_11130 [Bacillus pseudomycoides]